jgi:CTP synthase
MSTDKNIRVDLCGNDSRKSTLDPCESVVWKKEIEKIEKLNKEVKIGIVGKYFKAGDFVLSDAYISVIEAVKHASWHLGYKPKIDWLNSEEYEKDKNKLEELKNYNGIIIPGGFGSRGVEGKILAIQFCRENKIPILGLCYGLQLMVVEFARNICGLKGAHTTEVNPKTKYPVIDILEEQKKFLKEKLYGGTMRLGDWKCEIKRGTIAYRAYTQPRINSDYELINADKNILRINADSERIKTDKDDPHKSVPNLHLSVIQEDDPHKSVSNPHESVDENNPHKSVLDPYSSVVQEDNPHLSVKDPHLSVVERHRHRYEVNPKFHEILQKNGLVFSGTSEKGLLVEIIELPESIHPFFLGTQFHPELKSRFLHLHPLFVNLLKVEVGDG